MLASDNFYHTPIRYVGHFPKVTWARFSNTWTIFLVWSNLPKTLFWQVHNFFLSYFQDNLKTWSGRENTSIQYHYVLWEFILLDHIRQVLTIYPYLVNFLIFTNFHISPKWCHIIFFVIIGACLLPIFHQLLILCHHICHFITTFVFLLSYNEFTFCLSFFFHWFHSVIMSLVIPMSSMKLFWH